MDYIFKNKDGEKTVGEITYLHITPFYEFEIEMNNQKLRCYLEHLLSQWNICITDYDIDVELAHPTDIFWNSNAICEKIKDEVMSLKIAYAIKAVYSERDYSRDVL